VLQLEIGNGVCALAYQMNENEADFPSFVLGFPFVRSWCVTYNVDGQNIAFAKSKTK
jgi:hypothetical protein